MRIRTEVEIKLEKWVESNPDGYLNQPFSEIAAVAGVSTASVARNLPAVIARRDNILPSQVIEKRREKFGGRSRRLTQSQIEKIRKLNYKDTPIIDIAYILGISPVMVKNILKNEADNEE